MSRYFFDAETDGFVDQLTTIHSLVLMDVDDGTLISCCGFEDPEKGMPVPDGYYSIEFGLKLLAEADEIIGHNVIGFDLLVFKKLYPDWKTTAKITDTLILTRMLFADLKDVDFKARDAAHKRGQEPRLPGNLIGLHKLEAWGYRLGFNKGDFGTNADWSTWTQEMQDYCDQDVRVTARLYHMMATRFDLEEEWGPAIDLEMRFFDLIVKQERHGFNFDVEGAEELAQAIRLRKLEAEGQLFHLFEPWWVQVATAPIKKTVRQFIQSPHGSESRVVKVETGETYQHTFKNGRVQTRKVKEEVTQYGYWDIRTAGDVFTKAEMRVFNPGSRHHIANRLKTLYGWVPTEFTAGGDPKIDDEILGKLEYPPAKALAEFFMLEKRLSQIADGKQAWLKQQKNGRIHGRVNTLGAVTSRCTHSNPNVAQVPSIMNAKGVVPYGGDCRALYQPDEGHVLIGCDAAGLELRCLAHFMKDEGRYANIVLNGKKSEGTDIHTLNQKAAGLPTRANAKTFI
jgi:hypothetical protein